MTRRHRKQLRQHFDGQLQTIEEDVLAELIVDVERYGFETAVARALVAFEEKVAELRTPAEIELERIAARRAREDAETSTLSTKEDTND